MSLYGRLDPAPNAVGNVLIAHGYAEHLGRYDQLTSVLNRAGLNVYRYDHFGHGKSDGPRANVDVNELVRQHYRVRKQIAQQSPSLPLFLLGHSMGGLITVVSALGQPNGVAGVVLSGPALGLRTPVGGAAADALYEISKLVPHFFLAPFDPSTISRRDEVVQGYLNDDLNYKGAVPALTGASMLALSARVADQRRIWRPNTLIIQGAEDQAVSVAAVREFAEEAGQDSPISPAIDYVEVPAAMHEVFNEPEGPILMTLAAQWIKDQI